MGGNFQTNTTDASRKVIEKWMLSSIKNGGITKYDDLHVDDIQPAWSDRDTWIDAGLQALRLATTLRDLHRLDFTVAAAYSLHADRTSCEVSYKKKEILQENLDWSPPSIYLFPRRREPWTDIDVVAQDVDKVIVECSRAADTPWIKYWCYMEFRQGEERLRSVFAAG